MVATMLKSTIICTTCKGKKCNIHYWYLKNGILEKQCFKAVTLCSPDTSKLKVQERFTIKLHLVAHESALQVSASFNINQQWKSLVTMWNISWPEPQIQPCTYILIFSDKMLHKSSHITFIIMWSNATLRLNIPLLRK